MNEYQTQLWNDLQTLVHTSEAFYSVDQSIDGLYFRIFSYRLANYTEFMKPGGVECRGHMFEITQDGNPIRLAAIPMQKFWNLNENPLTMNLDLSKIDYIMLKADGSLISTYLHNGELRVKSKTSLASDQAVAAMNLLRSDEYKDLAHELLGIEKLGFTINMEYVAPTNRIVIGYDKPALIILNIRSRDDGSYVDSIDLDSDNFPTILSNWIEYVDLDETFIKKEEFVADIPSMQGVEGYVVRLESGQLVKIKTEWYLVQHRAKDSINSPRRLFEAVLEEASDDLRSLFFDDPLALKMIEEMEVKVEKMYNHLVATVEKFYDTNNHLERKDYAILGQSELDRMYFGLAMNKYLGKSVEYKTFMKSKWKEFGIKDIELVEEDV